MANEFKNQKLFDKSIKKIMQNGLHDKAYKVRLLSISSFKVFSSFLDDAYVIDNIFKELVRISTDNTEFYSFRVTSIFGLEAITENLSAKDKVKDQYLKTIIKLTEDSIVNVRQSAVKVLIGICQRNLFPDTQEASLKVLEGIRMNETDAEIKMLATKFLK